MAQVLHAQRVRATAELVSQAVGITAEAMPAASWMRENRQACTALRMRRQLLVAVVGVGLLGAVTSSGAMAVAMRPVGVFLAALGAAGWVLGRRRHPDAASLAGTLAAVLGLVALASR